MAKQRIVIDLYDHTPESEIADIVDSLRSVGIDGARVERHVALGGGNPHTLDGWRELGGYVSDPDTGAIVWTTNRELLDALGVAPRAR